MSVNKSQVTLQLKRRKKFAQVPNELFPAKISVQARLVWAYLMSEGPGWDSSVGNLARNLGINRSAATRAVQELRNHNMISTRQTKSGTDFTMHMSDQWLVEWTQGVAVSPNMEDTPPGSPDGNPVTSPWAPDDSPIARPLTKSEAPAASFENGIQYFNTTNTSNTTDRVQSGWRIEEEGTSMREERDWWQLHFLKNSFYREGYLSLTPEIQRSLRKRYPEANDKKDFLAEMDARLCRNIRATK